MVSREEEDKLNSLRDGYRKASKQASKAESKKRHSRKFSDVKEAMRMGEEGKRFSGDASRFQKKAYMRGAIKRYVENLPEHHQTIGSPAWGKYYSFPNFIEDMGELRISSPGDKRIVFNKVFERLEELPFKDLEDSMDNLQLVVNFIENNSSGKKMQQHYLSKLYTLAKEKGVKKKFIQDVFAIKEEPYIGLHYNEQYGTHIRDFASKFKKNAVRYKTDMKYLTSNRSSFPEKIEVAEKIADVKRNLKPVYKQLFNALQKNYSPENEKLYKEFIIDHPSQGLTNLEKAVFGSAITASFLGSLLFLSSNITGNAILNSSFNLSNSIGVGLFLVAVVGAFLYVRKTNKSQKKVTNKKAKKTVKSKSKKKKSKK